MLTEATKKPIIAISIIVGLIAVMICLGLLLKWPLAMEVLTWLSFLGRFIVALYAIIPVVVVGHWVTGHVFRRPHGGSAIWSILAAWATGWAVIVVTGIILISSGLYSPIIWIVFAFTVNVLFVIHLARRNWQPLTHFRKDVFPALQRNLSGDLAGPAAMWNILILLLVALGFLQAMIPPNTRDELAYHLVLPRLWEFQRNWWIPVDNYHLLFPANMEVVWGYGLAVGGLHLPRLITLMFGVLTIALMRKWLTDIDLDSWTRGFSLFFFLITPLALVMIAVNDVEWPMLFFVLLGYMASRQYAEAKRTSYFLLTTLCWGISVGIKYTAVPVVALLGCGWIFSLARRLSARRALMGLLALTIGILVFAAPWFIRNYYLTGDPIHPLGQLLPISTPDATTTNLPDINSLSRYENLPDFWRWNQFLYYAMAGAASDYFMHPGWPLLHWLVILFGWKSARYKPWLTVVLLSALLFYFSPSPRIFFPLMGLTWLFLPDYANVLGRHQASRLTVSALMLLFATSSFGMVFHSWFMSYNRSSQDYLIGILDDTELLQKDDIITPVVRWVRERTPKSSRIWVWCEDKVFYFDRWVRPDSPYDYPAFLHTLQTRGAEGLSQEIEKDRINYVIVNTARCAFPLQVVKMEKMAWPVSESISQDLRLWMDRNLRPIAKDHRFELYEVL